MTAIPLSAVDEDSGARTLVGEASNQGVAGMTAVAWVIRNRIEWRPSAWWGSSVDQVCRKHAQFSCWLPALNGRPNLDFERIVRMQTTDHEYLRALSVLRAVMDGDIPDPTGGATTYKITGTAAAWDHAVASMPPRVIGAHSLWRLSPTGPVLAFLDQAEETANV